MENAVVETTACEIKKIIRRFTWQQCKKLYCQI